MAKITVQICLKNQNSFDAIMEKISSTPKYEIKDWCSPDGFDVVAPYDKTTCPGYKIDLLPESLKVSFETTAYVSIPREDNKKLKKWLGMVIEDINVWQMKIAKKDHFEESNPGKSPFGWPIYPLIYLVTNGKQIREDSSVILYVSLYYPKR